MPAKVDFAKLFTDPKLVADDVVVKLGEAEFTMGDLRAYDQQRGGEISAELKRQQAALAKDKGDLQTASERVANLFIELNKEKAKLGTRKQDPPENVDPLAAFDNDPVFGSMAKVIRENRAEVAALQKGITDKLDAINRTLSATGTAVIGEKAARDFAEIMSGDDPVRPKDLTLDTLHKLAVEHRHYDKNQLPDIKATYDELTRDARHKHELEAARVDERAKIKAEQDEAVMLPPPGIGGHRREPDKNAPKNLNDAFNKAAGDRDMWKDIRNPNLIGGGAIQ